MHGNDVPSDPRWFVAIIKCSNQNKRRREWIERWEVSENRTHESCRMLPDRSIRNKSSESRTFTRISSLLVAFSLIFSRSRRFLCFQSVHAQWTPSQELAAKIVCVCACVAVTYASCPVSQLKCFFLRFSVRSFRVKDRCAAANGTGTVGHPVNAIETEYVRQNAPFFIEFYF